MPYGIAKDQEEDGQVEIADVEAALKKVRDFIALLEQNEQLSKVGVPDTPQRKQTGSQIREHLPLIQQIADRLDPELVVKLKEQSYGWRYHRTLEASRELAGLLDSAEETERILGPVGPKLAAANLHPWIWNAAVNLWDNGHLREAVQAAAAALFDHHLGSPRLLWRPLLAGCN